MNAREQYLKMRCDRLEAELKACLLVLDRALADLEFTESVGAAFAFDLAQRTNASLSDGSPFYGFGSNRLLNSLNTDWDDAVSALESQKEGK